MKVVVVSLDVMDNVRQKSQFRAIAMEMGGHAVESSVGLRI